MANFQEFMKSSKKAADYFDSEQEPIHETLQEAVIVN